MWHTRAAFALAFILTLGTLFFICLLSIATPVFAQAGCPPDTGGLPNPLDCQYSSVPGFIRGALLVLVKVSIPILTLFIVWSGFLFVTARGNSGKLETAKSNFVYVIIGALLILGAWVIATLIGGTIKQLTDTTPIAAAPASHFE